MELSCYNSYYEIRLETLWENYEKILRFTAPARVIPVLKANAYGMGTSEMAQMLVDICHCPILACAQVYEGLAIRQSGVVTPDILSIGPVLEQAMPHAVRWDLQIPVFTVEGALALAREAKRQGKRARAQIKLETGLNRIGIHPGEELEQLIQTLKQLSSLEICGAFTHFAQAEDRGDSFTQEQFRRFQLGVEQLRGAGFPLAYVHCCNTGATEWYREAVRDPYGPYHDYYLFRENEDGREPNNWTSFFGQGRYGDAWRYIPETDEWALHLFSPKQMDLNWDNPRLRKSIIAMVKWWLEKGVDGFRPDVINYISK